MKLKLTLMLLCVFALCIFSSSTYGALIIRDDGSSMNYAVDDEQVIKIKTKSGESNIKLNDILWLAGENTLKRIRLKEKMRDKPIIGDIEIKEAIRTKDNNEIVPLKNIIFYLNTEIHKALQEEFKKFDKASVAANVIESSHALKISPKRRDIESVNSFLLPFYWEGAINISNPKYQKTISRNESVEITLDIEGDDGLYSNLYENADNLAWCSHWVPIEDKTGFRSMIETAPQPLSAFKDSLPKSKGLKGSIKINVGIPSGIYGEGYFYLYLTSIKNNPPEGLEQLLSFKTIKGKPILIVYRTVSNVLQIPLNIE